MNPFGNSKDFDARMDTGVDATDVDFLFLGAGGPALTEKPIDQKPAEVKRPYYLGMEKKIVNAYPQLSKIVAEAEMDPDEREAIVQENLAALDVQSPDQFGVKYAGKLGEMAQEHGIGQLLGYSFRRRKIEVIGSEKILLLDYQLNPLHTRDVYGVDAPVSPDAEEEAAEPAEPAAENDGEEESEE